MLAIFCRCCPKKGGDADEEAALAQLPRVRVGKRGSDVKVAECDTDIKLSGEGVAVADTAIEQDAAYWEVRVEKIGVGCQIGVSRNLTGPLLESQLGDQDSSWSVSTGENGAVLAEGDVIGVAYGQGDIPNLRFFHNGEPIEEASVLRIKGEAYPAVSVCSGTELRWIFDPRNFEHNPPGRHSEVQPPRKMI